MLVDFRHGDPPEPTGARRTVVVGAGAAGLAVALSLEEAGHEVLLIESGGDPRDADSMAEAGSLNEGTVVGHRYAGLTGARARVLGGATQLWFGQCTRMQDIDFAARAWVPGSGWPLTPADLAPWYDQAERWFGLTGRGYEASRWREHADLEPIAWSPDRLEHDFSEFTNRVHWGSRFHRRLRASTLVTVLQHATAVRVVTEGDRAVGVTVRGLGGRAAEVRGADVVLAGGAIENARLLMLSDHEHVGLGTGRRTTGLHLQDHPVVETLEIFPRDRAHLQDRFMALHRGRHRIYPKVRLQPAATEREGLTDANAVFLHHRDDPGLDAVRRLLAAARSRELPDRPLRDIAQAAGAVPALARTVYRRRIKGLSGGALASRVTMQVWLEQPADPQSAVRLGAARDPLGLPVAEVDWRVGELEMRTSRVFSRWVAQDLRRLDLATVRELPPMEDDEAWAAAVGDAYHPSGTTRMSRDPSQGVVDEHCRVHGILGLHVAGSSTFPVAGYANPTLTIVSMALRLAHRLARANDTVHAGGHPVSRR